MSSLLFMALFSAVHGQQNSGDGGQVSRQIVVIVGAVGAPGRFEFRENLRLNELITCAGGLTEHTGKSVQVFHLGEARARGKSGDSDHGYFDFYSLASVLRGEEGSNPVVRAGDLIEVLESDPVFVVGYVVTPLRIDLKEPITLTEAIATAGGVTMNSKPDRIRIIRQTVGSQATTEITVDLKAIKKRREVDPMLQPFDVIDVPGRPGDKIGKLGEIDLFGTLPLRAGCKTISLVNQR